MQSRNTVQHEHELSSNRCKIPIAGYFYCTFAWLNRAHALRLSSTLAVFITECRQLAKMKMERNNEKWKSRTSEKQKGAKEFDSKKEIWICKDVIFELYVMNMKTEICTAKRAIGVKKNPCTFVIAVAVEFAMCVHMWLFYTCVCMMPLHIQNHVSLALALALVPQSSLSLRKT